MTHGLSEQKISSYEDTKKWINLWIASKDADFFRRRFHMLPERWRKELASDGQYFE